MTKLKNTTISILIMSGVSSLVAGDCPTIPDDLSYQPRINQDQYEQSVKTTPILILGPQVGIQVQKLDTMFFGTCIEGSSFIGTKINCRGLDFANATGVKFNNSKLLFTKFIGANVSKADFTNADLQFADFYGAIATSSIFSNAKLSYARFDNTDLTDASFIGDSDLECVIFRNCILKGTKFNPNIEIKIQNCTF